MTRIVFGIICAGFLMGCASGKKADTIAVGATSQPATIDASQITAQVVAQARQELKADVQAQVNATVQGFGTYNSEYGLGAVLTVILKDLISFIIQCLVIWGLLRLVAAKDERSHLREMKRIEGSIAHGKEV